MRKPAITIIKAAMPAAIPALKAMESVTLV
jgi:hypothetical protein